MGYRVGDQCFEDPSEAAQAFCGSVVGMTSSGYMRCNFAEWQDPSVFYTYTTVAPDGSETGQSGNAYLSACTLPEPFAFLHFSAEDGFVLSVAVIGVLACAFSIRALVRVLDTADTQSSE